MGKLRASRQARFCAGVIGDLVSGEVDLGVAALIQTSEKAEVVDFAAPYFDLSGISIALRKKVPIQSFFKFALVFTPGERLKYRNQSP